MYKLQTSNYRTSSADLDGDYSSDEENLAQAQQRASMISCDRDSLTNEAREVLGATDPEDLEQNSEGEGEGEVAVSASSSLREFMDQDSPPIKGSTLHGQQSNNNHSNHTATATGIGRLSLDSPTDLRRGGGGAQVAEIEGFAFHDDPPNGSNGDVNGQDIELGGSSSWAFCCQDLLNVVLDFVEDQSGLDNEKDSPSVNFSTLFGLLNDKYPLVQHTLTQESIQAASSSASSGAGPCLDRKDFCLCAAEEDGSLMDDLPSFSLDTDVLAMGVNDFILASKEGHSMGKKDLLHVRIERTATSSFAHILGNRGGSDSISIGGISNTIKSRSTSTDPPPMRTDAIAITPSTQNTQAAGSGLKTVGSRFGSFFNSRGTVVENKEEEPVEVARSVEEGAGERRGIRSYSITEGLGWLAGNGIDSMSKTGKAGGSRLIVSCKPFASSSSSSCSVSISDGGTSTDKAGTEGWYLVTRIKVLKNSGVNENSVSGRTCDQPGGLFNLPGWRRVTSLGTETVESSDRSHNDDDTIASGMMSPGSSARDDAEWLMEGGDGFSLGMSTDAYDVEVGLE